MDKQEKTAAKKGAGKKQAAKKRAGMNLGNVKKIDQLMARDRDLKAPEGGTKLRYVVCATPRSGSELVTQMLQATGLAGDPQEYLNQAYMAGYVRLRAGDQKLELREYLEDMEARRTSPNGVFGAKMHFEHLQALWKNRMRVAAGFLKRFDKFILVTRRDKVAQAVALHKAREAVVVQDASKAGEEAQRPVKAGYNPALVAKALTDVAMQEEAWRTLLTAAQFPFLEVAYEDLVANYEKESARILEHLGISGAKVGAPALDKLEDDQATIAKFRQYLGSGTAA